MKISLEKSISCSFIQQKSRKFPEIYAFSVNFPKFRKFPENLHPYFHIHGQLMYKIFPCLKVHGIVHNTRPPPPLSPPMTHTQFCQPYYARFWYQKLSNNFLFRSKLTLSASFNQKKLFYSKFSHHHPLIFLPYIFFCSNRLCCW